LGLSDFVIGKVGHGSPGNFIFSSAVWSAVTCHRFGLRRPVAVVSKLRAIPILLSWPATT